MLSGSPVIDAHHHFLPRAVLDRLREEAHGAPRLVNDRISITLTADLADPAVHLRTMDEGGVDAAVLTYSGVSVLGMDVCRQLNDGFASLQEEHRGRFYGSVHVCLHEPELAPAELRRGASELGLRAVALATSEAAITLDQPSLDPVWQTISELDLPVILHPALLPQGASTDYSLERSCYRPFDTTTAAVRLLQGVLPRFPNLRIVLPHIGGTAIFLRGRIAMFYEPAGWTGTHQRGAAKSVREQQRLGLADTFEEGWSKFFFDTAGTGGWSPAVEMATRVVGPERLLFGSDYPLESHSGDTVRELVDMIEGLPLSLAERQQIGGQNAARLFGLQ